MLHAGLVHCHVIRIRSDQRSATRSPKKKTSQKGGRVFPFEASLITILVDTIMAMAMLTMTILVHFWMPYWATEPPTRTRRSSLPHYILQPSYCTWAMGHARPVRWQLVSFVVDSLNCRQVDVNMDARAPLKTKSTERKPNWHVVGVGVGQPRVGRGIHIERASCLYCNYHTYEILL
jgi:hypothetical protein